MMLCIALLLALFFSNPEVGFAGDGKQSACCHLDHRLFGFRTGRSGDEQMCSFIFRSDVHVHITAPVNLPAGKRILLILFALPNGNTLDHTFGKRLQSGDDWRYDIQHTGAQVRFVHSLDPDFTPVLILLQTRQRSWPGWRAAHPTDHGVRVIALADTLRDLFNAYRPKIMLTGHSGGGRFIFSFLDQAGEIPDDVARIAFIDSNYGYEEKYAAPLGRWLGRGGDHALMVFAYNDSVALLDGRRVVSDSGGTWHRSGRMRHDLARYLSFTVKRDSVFQHASALAGRVQFWLKENPRRGIWHTQQVERNGLIHAILAGTRLENHGYRYWGERAYAAFIGEGSQLVPDLAIPPRSSAACTGSQFIAGSDTLTGARREEAIWRELQSGNIPEFLRRPVLIEKRWADVAGDSHQVVFAVLPDYLAIGTDSDFVRMPMTPFTAQKAADLFGAVLPTRKLVDAIWAAAPVKLTPQFYAPLGDRNERPAMFLQHQRDIERQRRATGARLGALTAGHKKDLVLSNAMALPDRLDHVVIYGWHQPDGRPIQPLTNIHIGRYVDYSHGVRLLPDVLLVDGVPRGTTSLLADPLLYTLISDEEGVMTVAHYPSK